MTTAKKAPFTVYQPTNTKNWYVRFSVKGQGQKRIALGTDDKHAAEQIAVDIYRNANNIKIPKEQKTVRDIATEQIRAGTLTQSQQSILTRYIVGFWGEELPTHITQTEIDKYRLWRKTYWTEGPGRNVNYIEFERNGTLIKRKVIRAEPSASTLRADYSVLKSFLKFCRDKHYITTSPEIKSTKITKRKKISSFKREEIRQVFLYLQKDWEDHQDKKSKSFEKQYAHSHLMTLLFFLLLTHTGMTVEECTNLRWSDMIGISIDDKPIDKPDNIFIKIRHRTKPRTVVPLIGLATLFNILTKIQLLMKLDFREKDHIWRNAKGQHIKNVADKVLDGIKKCNLINDEDGEPRTLAAIRTFYIHSVIKSIGYVSMVAENVGMSLYQLEKVYGIQHNQAEEALKALRSTSIF